MYTIFSIFLWIFFVATNFILMPLAFVVWLITFPIDKRRVVLHQYTSFWAWFLVAIVPFWKPIVIGREKITNDKAFILIANHQSMVDILILYRIFRQFKWVSKIELFKVPVVGWLLSLNKYIPIERGSKNSAQKMYDLCYQTINQGNSIMIFPEGTRSNDGEIRNFKEGAFKIALHAQKAIVPIVINGAADAMPKHSLILKKKTKIVVQILDPIPYESFKNKDASIITSEIQQLMKHELEKVKKLHF